MNFLMKRSIALVIAAVIILGSIGFGAHRSLVRLRQDVETVFYNGVNDDGLGIENDLNARIDLSYNLVTVARRYLAADDTAIETMLEARDQLSRADTPSDKYAANLHLTEAVTVLYDKLDGYQLSDADSRYRSSLYADLSSRNATISHDPYNERAEAFNQDILGAFPANLLKKLTFVTSIDLFR